MESNDDVYKVEGKAEKTLAQAIEYIKNKDGKNFVKRLGQYLIKDFEALDNFLIKDFEALNKILLK